MEALKVFWSRDALADLNKAHEFIAEENPSAARGIIERMETLLESLSVHPKLGRVGRVKGTRELVVTGTPFILPYAIDKRRIIILGVRHAARKWPTRFKKETS